MPHMLPVFQRVFQDCGDGVSFEISDEEFNGRFYQAACNLQAYSDNINPYHLFMTNLANDIRAVKIIRYLQKQAKEPLFVGMFPLHACMNHSCDHNVDVRDGGRPDLKRLPGVMVVANRDIKKGEELCTTYINPQMARVLRRAWLFKSFNFWCQCKKCIHEGDDSSYCTDCGKNAATGKGFLSCGKCKRAFYCSKACQKSSWHKGHKLICQKSLPVQDSQILEIDNKLKRYVSH
ncbi:hypothetical protein SNE40_013267 [Patella caerulea]|uniref:Uncharacterized protein n=1 Tax=Patella caerulea TaxID=87958 RepID=A0AAN8PTE4_PATCE